MIIRKTQRSVNRRLPRLAQPACIAALLAAGALAYAPAPAHSTPPPGFSYAWRDDFKQPVGSAPNPKNWNLEVLPSGANNGELESYDTNPVHAHVIADPNASDGYALQIQATSDGNGKYSSARMDTKGLEMPQYGYIEARLKMPYGQGLWPAFWMLGSDIDTVSWPDCGEMDIMENIGNQQWYGRNQGSLHSQARNGGNALGAAYYLPSGETFHDAYHEFQMLWSPGSVSYYVDNHLYETHTYADLPSGEWPYDAPFFFIMNVAVGGDWPGSPDATTVFPQNMLVDYVHVYKGTEQTPSIPPKSSASTGFDDGIVNVHWSYSLGTTHYIVSRAAPGAPMTVVSSDVTQESYSDSGLQNGTAYTYSVQAANVAGTSAASPTFSATTLPAGERAYGATPTLPGTLQACNYDAGGEGYGYHVGNPPNHGSVYRPTNAVTCLGSPAPGTPYDVEWISSGDWLKYTVNVAKAGVYNLTLGVANANPGAGTLHIGNSLNSATSGELSVPNTGGWQDWSTVTGAINLPAGKQVLTIYCDNASYNLGTLTLSQ